MSFCVNRLNSLNSFRRRLDFFSFVPKIVDILVEHILVQSSDIELVKTDYVIICSTNSRSAKMIYVHARRTVKKCCPLYEELLQRYCGAYCSLTLQALVAQKLFGSFEDLQKAQ